MPLSPLQLLQLQVHQTESVEVSGSKEICFHTAWITKPFVLCERLFVISCFGGFCSERARIKQPYPILLKNGKQCAIIIRQQQNLNAAFRYDPDFDRLITERPHDELKKNS